jgi:DHA1 family tetracycline resistance protein-like MFS transporter
MSRPLFVLFLTILVNLIGFGIIIPLLPFYATSYGASPVVIGLLFASFSISQLFAAPLLGEWSDRWGRRPVLILSLIGTTLSFVLLALAGSLPMLFLARIVDGLSGGNITTARAYIADVTTPENRAKAYGMLGAAFGLGFILGPALGGFFSRYGYTAPIWVAAVVSLLATLLAWFWLPETLHATSATGGGSPWKAIPAVLARPHLRVLLCVDFVYWMSFAVYQTTFALFGAHRFGFDAQKTGYFLSAFGFLGVIVQGALVGPIVRRLGERRTLTVGLLLTAIGWGGSAMTYSLPVFVLLLVPGAMGIGLCNATLSALISHSAEIGEQGRVQGAAGALESIGRASGPVWGNAALQHFGEATPYAAAAILLVGAATVIGRAPDPGPHARPRIIS